MNAYFVYDYYSVAGSPKAEAAVMAYAQKEYMYLLISERALDAVVNDLKAVSPEAVTPLKKDIKKQAK